jgi:hypothetical protein
LLVTKKVIGGWGAGAAITAAEPMATMASGQKRIGLMMASPKL